MISFLVNGSVSKTPPANPVAMVFNPITPQCTYSPRRGTSWTYPAPGNPGCTPGTGPEIFADQGGWTFQVVPYNVQSQALAISNASRMRGIGKTGASSDVRIKGDTILRHDIDLRTTSMSLNRVVREAAGAEELVNDSGGNTFAPTLLDSDPRATTSRATLASRPDALSRIQADLKYDTRRRGLNLDVSVEGGTIASPLLCMGDPPTTRLAIGLAIELELRDATNRPLLLAQVEGLVVRQRPRRKRDRASPRRIANVRGTLPSPGREFQRRSSGAGRIDRPGRIVEERGHDRKCAFGLAEDRVAGERE